MLAGAVWAGPQAFHYIENKLSNPQQAAIADSAGPAPYVTEIAPPTEPVSAAPEPLPSVIPVLAAPPSAAPKPKIPAKANAASIKPPSAAPPPVVAPPPPPPKPMAAMEDVEACLRQVAKACDVSTSEFRADGQFSAGERRLLGAAIFPDGAEPTAANLAACKASSSRRAINTPEGKALCAAMRQPAP